MTNDQSTFVFNHMDFAESHKGSISNHKFNEAINGVFRSKKQLNEKDPKHKPAEKKTDGDKGLRTLDKMIPNRGGRRTDRRMIDNDNEHVHENLSSRKVFFNGSCVLDRSFIREDCLWL